MEVKSIKAKANASKDLGFRLEVDIQSEKRISSVSIPAGDYHAFDRNNSLDYFAVIDNSGNKIANNYEVRANHSYIVTKDKAFVRQKYGSNDLFERR